MAGALASFVESLLRAVRRDAGGTGEQRPARARVPRREVPEPERAKPAATPELDLWKEPVPLMEDRDGHLHLLI